MSRKALAAGVFPLLFRHLPAAIALWLTESSERFPECLVFDFLTLVSGSRAGCGPGTK